MEHVAAGPLAPLRISAFPRGSDVWRINWLGPVGFPNRSSRSTQPSVQVRLSKIATNNALNPLRTVFSPSSSEQFICWVSVGTLMLLRIGDLWSEQTPVATPDYEVEHLAATNIDATTTTLVKAGSSIQNGKFLLPLREHPWHLGSTQSYCACVALPEGKRLVVPCMELIRFYFGSSSELLSRLFTPPFDKERLFTRMVQNVSGSRMELDLAQGLPRASATDVGRIAGSRAALRAAASISTSCSRASAIGNDAYPRTTFPFEGTTDLVAAGKWLSGDRGERETFLVFNLRSCSYPFPFKTLKYRLGDADQSKAPNKSSATTSSSAQKPIRTQQREPRSPTLHEQDASKHLSLGERRIAGRRQFPDLERKSVWANRDLRTAESGGMRFIAPVEEMAVGDPGSGAHIRPIAIADAGETKNAPDFLRELLASFRGLKSARIMLLTAGHSDGWTIPVPHQRTTIDAPFPTEGGVVSRAARVAAFSIEQSEERALLVAIEDDAVTIVLCPMPPTRDADLQNLLSDVYEGSRETSRMPDLRVDLEGAENAPALMGSWIQDHLSPNTTDGSARTTDD